MQDSSETTADIFNPVPLSGPDLKRVYPLVRMVEPAVTLAQWLAFARRSFGRLRGGKARDKGLIALQDVRGYIHAAYSYAVDARLTRGPLLRVDALLVGRLPGRVLNDALLKSIEEIAAAAGCESIQIALIGFHDEFPDAGIRGLLVGAGYRTRPPALVRDHPPLALRSDHRREPPVFYRP